MALYCLLTANTSIGLVPLELYCHGFDFNLIYFDCGPGSSSRKALGSGLDGLGLILGIGRVENFLHSSCPD